MEVYISSNTSAFEGEVKGISAGNLRILIEFAKRWLAYDNAPKIHLLTTKDGVDVWSTYNLLIDYVVIQRKKFTEFGTISWHVINTIRGIWAALTMPVESGNVAIITASEFSADAIPGIILKRRIKGSKWIAGFYLFAPNPFSGNVYSGFYGRLKNLLWYLSEKPMYWLVKKNADMVFTTNDLDRDRFKGGRISDNHIITVGIGADTDLPDQVPEPATKEFDAVFLGRFHPQKGLLELFDIWKIVVGSRRDARLAIIGMGPLEEKAKQKARDLGLQDNVTFFGFRDGIEKFRILKNSKVFVEPSIYASGGLAAYDALSCGLPAVSFDLPVWHSYYPLGFKRVPLLDLEGFAQSILCLLTDESEYRKLREEALSLARSVSWHSKAKEVYDKISDLFAGK